MSANPGLAAFAAALPASLPATVRRAFADAAEVQPAAEIERAVDRIAVHITVDLQDRDPCLVCVLPDGFVFTGMLLRRLAMPLRVTQMVDDTDVLETLDDRDCVLLVCGRASDQRGRRLRGAVRNSGQGGREVFLAALIATAGAADYTAIEGSGDGLIGSGLDYAGYGANLPGLYRRSGVST